MYSVYIVPKYIAIAMVENRQVSICNRQRFIYNLQSLNGDVFYNTALLSFVIC